MRKLLGRPGKLPATLNVSLDRRARHSGLPRSNDDSWVLSGMKAQMPCLGAATNKPAQINKRSEQAIGDTLHAGQAAALGGATVWPAIFPT